MSTKLVEVRTTVEVAVDDSKFTPEWMRSFRESFYSFHRLDDHLQHLAQLAAREIIYQPQVTNDFIEGYGNANGMGIATRIVSVNSEVLKS